MIAFFIARANEKSSCESEFERYRHAVAGLPFQEHTTCDDVICDRRKYLVLPVGACSVCVVCEAFAHSGGRSLLLEESEDELLRLSSVIERVTAIADMLNIPSDKTWIFMHNGGDIPPGYEVWANDMLHEAEGYAEWNIGLLSSSELRNQCFDLGAIHLEEHLGSESEFEKWVNDLGAALRKAGGIS